MKGPLRYLEEAEPRIYGRGSNKHEYYFPTPSDLAREVCNGTNLLTTTVITYGVTIFLLLFITFVSYLSLMHVMQAADPRLRPHVFHPNPSDYSEEEKKQ